MRKKVWLFIAALFLGLTAYVIYLEWVGPFKRKQNFAVTKGNIVGVSPDIMNGSYSADINYKILVNGKEITRLTRITYEKSNVLFMLFNKNMDVVYEKDDPGNCELLLTRNSYREYNLLPAKDVLRVLEELEAACGAIH
ncbi:MULTISPECIES: hypothetical protein [Niastella]|uniref:Uncharacterized protein n=1 Tax=Niastella soli TaxID=2821487 RepID=A0ABS3Z1P5_9BACT|nr:hypothetical protein [Niastella soli]MBO9204039.1 hypothetical protein [Niastella soli]